MCRLMFAIQFLLIYLFNFLTAYSYNSVNASAQLHPQKSQIHVFCASVAAAKTTLANSKCAS